MITYFPEIYPDELVYSWFCRYFVHSGYLVSSIALKEMLAKRCNTPSKEFIGNINDDAKAVISQLYPMNELVLQHTMYPQYARFVPLEQKREALYYLANDFCDAHHLFAILPRCEKERYLKYCPLCASEDRQTYGEAYWHRKHQIRNMRICPKHGCELLDSNVTAKSEQDYTLNPAEEAIGDMSVIEADNPSEIQYAEYMESVFDAPMDFVNDTPIGAVLYRALGKADYLKASGKARHTALLADNMQSYYEKMGLNSIASVYQIQRVLLGNRFDFSVICQIAFYLGVKKDDLLASLTQAEIEKERDTHYMKDAAPIDWKQYDDEMFPLIERTCRDIYNGAASETGRPDRISEKFLYRKLGLSKYNLAHMPKCQAVYEKYSESYGESYARRIVWAYQRLKAKKQDMPVYWTDIRHLSGVKKKNFPAACPFLLNYADERIVGEITEIVYNQN